MHRLERKSHEIQIAAVRNEKEKANPSNLDIVTAPGKKNFSTIFGTKIPLKII